MTTYFWMPLLKLFHFSWLHRKHFNIKSILWTWSYFFLKSLLLPLKKYREKSSVFCPSEKFNDLLENLFWGTRLLRCCNDTGFAPRRFCISSSPQTFWSFLATSDLIRHAVDKRTRNNLYMRLEWYRLRPMDDQVASMWGRTRHETKPAATITTDFHLFFTPVSYINIVALLKKKSIFKPRFYLSVNRRIFHSFSNSKSVIL